MGTEKNKRRAEEAVVVFVKSKKRTVLVFDASYKEPLPKLPSGDVEKGESVETAAAREVREETGVQILPGQLRYVRTQFLQGGHKRHFFVAEVSEQQILDRKKIGDENGNPIKTMVVERSELRMMVILPHHKRFIGEVEEWGEE